MFGDYDFGLTDEQEERAATLHRESIIIDTLFQGPCGYRSFTDEMVEELKDGFEKHRSAERGLWDAVRMPIRGAIKGEFPDFKDCWDESGITAGNRQTGGNSVAEAFQTFSLNQAQFDNLPWLIKATTALDFRRAKAEGVHAGFVSMQNTVDVGHDLDNLNRYWDMGMRMIQLTYNSVNFVGGGCTDRVDCGVTDFGVKFIGRMNELGIIVDTGHCGRQTTLDACAISTAPVVASHTSAEGVNKHQRAKSDEELQAIAETGGYIGVYLVAMFLRGEPGCTIEHFLDHIDYIAKLVGPQYIGVGSDWPIQAPEWGVQKLAEYAMEIGFREEHGVTKPVNVIGFDDYRDFPNITRGLVQRGYSDDEIRGILGGNFLRVFELVCG
ncbi:MAG TPA: membrane dipeptidase [Thermomicrobiales bacterium]|nr:membrane dipeptidase [Thermomicrobiales bacterium]